VKLNTAPSPRGYRSSPRLRKIGIVVLGAFVVGYLVVITSSWSGALVSPRRLSIVLALWAIGVLALILLVRGYRQAAGGRKDVL
jgi:hypothetical protein